jgi:hypothetical protein
MRISMGGHVMPKIAITLSSAVLAASLSLPAAAAPKFVSWEGTWHLNKAETVYPKGVMVTDNDLIVTKDDGNILKYSETVVNAGQSMTQVYEGAYDNKPHDVGAGETMTFKHLTPTSYSAIRHNSTGYVTERSIFELKNDGKKLICHAWAKQPGGKPIKFDEIFDKGD